MSAEYIFYRGTKPDGRSSTCEGYRRAMKLMKLLKTQKIGIVKYKELRAFNSSHYLDPIIKITF